MRQTKCFVILGHFLPFHPLNNPENQNFEKIKNASRDVIILHLCIKNHNQSRCMLSEIWSVTNNFLSFWTIVCPYTSLLTPKIKIWKNCKKIRGRIILLHKFTLNEGHMMYGSWDIRHNGQFFVILGHFLPFDAPNPKNQNFEKIKKMKKKKKAWRYYNFTPVYHKWQSYDVLFLRYGARQTEFFVILDDLLPF